MKKAVMVNFINVINQDEQNYEIKIKNKGEVEICDGEYQVSFIDNSNELNSRVIVNYSSSKASLTRISDTNSSTLYFEPNKDVINFYSTPYGKLQMITRTLNYKINENGLILEYYLLIQNEINGKFKITLSISKECYDEC